MTDKKIIDELTAVMGSPAPTEPAGAWNVGSAPRFPRSDLSSSIRARVHWVSSVRGSTPRVRHAPHRRRQERMIAVFRMAGCYLGRRTDRAYSPASINSSATCRESLP